MKKVLVVRHGETLANSLDIFQGRLNNELTELTEKGLEHARKLAILCKDMKIKRIYSSPLKRAYVTAQEVGKAIGMGVIADDRIAECCYGNWEGKKKAELKSTKEWIVREKNKYSFIHPGIFKNEKDNVIKGESYKTMHERVYSFLKDLKEENDNGAILVVTHLGVLRVIAKHFHGLSEEEAAEFTPEGGKVYEISL